MDNFREFALNEMPIQINKLGGWGDKARPYGYKKDDIGIMNSERGVEKITRKWAKVKQNFNTFVCRSSQCFRHVEVGEVNANFVQEKLGLKIVPNPTQPNEIKIDPDAITYIVTNNRGAERVMLNYWTLAHRFGHAVAAGRDRTGQNNNNGTYAYFEREFWGEIRRVIEGVYGVRIPFNGRFVEGRNNMTIMKKVLETIGTMGSARKAQLREYFEFPHELLAQYIIEQKVKFNPLPRSIRYFKMPEESSYRRSSNGYGSYEPSQARGYQSSVYAKDPLDLESWNEYLTDGLAETVAYNLESVLDSCVGKIYVM